MKNLNPVTILEIEQICKDYTENHVSIAKIAKKYDRGIPKITKILKEANVEIITDVQRGQLIADQAEKMLEEGLSLTQIATILHADRNKISANLKKRGIEIVNHQNELKINEKVFDSIDTEEKAYWLGFLYADGALSSSKDGKNSFAVSLELQNSDKGHVQKFQKFMEGERLKLGKHNNKGHISWRFTCCNKHLWQTLNSLGCTPRKSLILKFPNFISDELVRHFIRGYFDGDGCLSYNRTKKSVRPRCSMLGTKEFLEKVCEKLKISTKCIKKDKRHQNNTFYIDLNKNDSNALVKHLYTNCSVSLERKLLRANFFLSNNCRSLEKFNELLSGKIGEGLTANPEENS